MSSVSTLPVYGIDPDRAQAPGSPVSALRRRLDGRYPIDPFGADPQLQDLLAPFLAAGVRVRVTHADRIPEDGPAVLVANRGFGIAEPAALAVGVRRECGRRLRVVGAPELPVFGDLVRKLGGVMSYAADLGALLRAGHLAALPLSPTWLRTGAGEPPIDLLRGALGYPVIPVAIRPGGPLGLAVRPWQVVCGRPLPPRVARGSRDPLAAAELAEAVRDGVVRLLDGAS